MIEVGIVTDSTCCLPKDLVEKYGIKIVPVFINYRGKSYRDGIDISASEVYRIMRKKQDLPTTSTPSAGDFLKAYEETNALAPNVFCITVTGLQSKVFESASLAASLAKEKMPGVNVQVMDSRAVSGALGFIALEAARTAHSGAPMEDVINKAMDIQGRVNFLAMVDTLYFLARTGRIAKAAAWAGSVLDIKPLLEHSPAIGVTTPFARPRTKEKAIEEMLKAMETRVGESKIHAMVHHADDEQDCRKLTEQIRNKFDCVEIHQTEFTPVMGVHSGPGVLAISFFTE
jgi:DegV family protein with EDD domain